ncbi:MAG TPA: N-acetylmuramoyl-L-alanine amidase [Planctomycetota bacterium]|nr:N-acetylmuramoyl-L-alanine amidase [Planctomycetota bacterium]
MLHFKRIAMLAAGAVLIGASGCSGNKNRAAATPRPELARSTATPPVAASTRASSPRLTIYTPRSQSELDAIYNTPSLSSPVAPREPRAVPVVAAPQYADEAIVGDASWNVAITRDWRHIVIHHSASATGSAAAFDKAHKDRGWDGLGYHFVIGNGTGSGDGEVEAGYRWTRQMQGAHAGNAEYNQAGIGICLVGDFQSGGHASSKQMASLRRLVRFLQARTGVPTSEVIGHGNVPGKSTECPGQYLDLAAFRQSLGNGAFGVNVHVANGGTAPAPRAAPARSTRVKASSSSASMP